MGLKITLTIALALIQSINAIPNSSTEKLKPIIEFKEQIDLEALRKEKLEYNIEKYLHQESSAYIEVDTNFEALVRATWRLETGNGTSRLWLTQNNAGGVKCGKEYCSYQTKEAGLEALKTLLSRYVDNFGYDLEAIRSVYSESNDTELFRQIYLEEGGGQNAKQN